MEEGENENGGFDEMEKDFCVRKCSEWEKALERKVGWKLGKMGWRLDVPLLAGCLPPFQGRGGHISTAPISDCIRITNSICFAFFQNPNVQKKSIPRSMRISRNQARLAHDFPLWATNSSGRRSFRALLRIRSMWKPSIRRRRRRLSFPYLVSVNPNY